MRTLSTLFFLLCNVFFVIGQDCPFGIGFSTQAEIDSFAINYPDCVELEGGISIVLGDPQDPITNFTGLQNITRLNYGGLNISNVSNTMVKADLTGLENLTTVGDRLEIDLTPDSGFESLKGLEGLTSVGGDVWLKNLAIDDFSGLDNLKSIGDGLVVEDCQFNNFQGLSSLDTIYGEFRIDANTFTDFFGLHSLKVILGELEVRLNTFENFNGLQSLTHVGGLESFNDSFTSLEGLENLTTINGDLDLVNTVIKNFEGLNQVTYLGYLSLWGTAITDFSGLENVKSILMGMDIGNNSFLISFKGLEQVEYIAGPVNITENPALLSISELENVDFSTTLGLLITNNHSLNFCSNIPICNFLVSGGDISLHDNGVDCSELESLMVQCAENLSKVRYFAYYDLNQNQGLDPDEPFYSDASLLVDPLASFNFDNSSNGGSIFLEEGDYNLSLNINDSWSFTTATSDIDPEILAVQFVDEPDTIVAPHRFGWHFDNLYPSQSIRRLISLQVPGPPDFPLGNLLNLFSFIEFDDQPWVQNATGFRYEPEVRCSFDPNATKVIWPRP